MSQVQTRTVMQLLRARKWREMDVWHLSDQALMAEVARYHYDLIVERAQHLYSLRSKREEFRSERRKLAESINDIDRYAVLMVERWERDQ